MRRYITRDFRSCTGVRRREIRQPVTTELNEQPRSDTLIVACPVMPDIPFRRDINDHLSYDSRYEMRQYVFEHICFTTMIWIEEHVEGGTSCGHYRMYNSYCQVPRGLEVSNTTHLPEGSMYHDRDTEPYRGLDGEQYYRVRMMELERRLEEIQRDRIILPQEQINDIHAGIKQGRDKPVPMKYFDEDMFKVE